MPPQDPQTPPFRVRWNQVTWYSKLAAIFVFLGVIPALCFYIGTQYQSVLDVQNSPAVIAPSPLSQKPAAIGYKDATYTIEGQTVTLETLPAVGQTVPETGSATHTYFFGDELKTDLNGDGRDDVAFIVVQTIGGSGSFYYVVGALQQQDGSYVGTDGYLLGDRIAPQNIIVSQDPSEKNVIVVNYADRAQGEPMSTQPSMGKSVYLKLDPATRKWAVVQPGGNGL